MNKILALLQLLLCTSSNLLTPQGQMIKYTINESKISAFHYSLPSYLTTTKKIKTSPDLITNACQPSNKIILKVKEGSARY